MVAMQNTLQQLVDLLDLERIEINLFRGDSRDIGSRSVFGGQVLGQALVAAGRTVEDRAVHSLHGYFLRPGDVNAPIVFDVDRIRDGKSFTTRRVVAIQHGRAIFNMAASFQVEEPGASHQAEMPAATPPEELENEMALREKIAHKVPEPLREKFLIKRPIEFRPVNPQNPFAPEKRPPRQQNWFRAVAPLPDDPAVHRAVLAYASDFGLMATSMLPHAFSFVDPSFQAASLDHAMWFHRPFRADEWMLYDMHSPNSGNARGLSFGSIYSRYGVLIASVAQEGLIRKRE